MKNECLGFSHRFIKIADGLSQYRRRLGRVSLRLLQAGDALIEKLDDMAQLLVSLPQVANEERDNEDDGPKQRRF